MVNPNLMQYVNTSIMPRYDLCDKGHRQDHIQYVIRRSLSFAATVPGIDCNIVYAAAAYHDLGCAVDRSIHNIISAQIVREDRVLREFFDENQIMLIAEAVEDHRASLKHEPRSVYGKIISSADRNTSLDSILIRSWEYRVEHNPDASVDWKVSDALDHIKSKFGPGGYAIHALYFPDPEFDAMLADTANLVSDPDRFRERLFAVNGVK